MILAVNAVDENTKNCGRNFIDGEFEHGSTENADSIRFDEGLMLETSP